MNMNLNNERTYVRTQGFDHKRLKKIKGNNP